MGFRDVDADGMSSHLRQSYACHACRNHAYPFRPLVKTAADQTKTRSITTKLHTIQPPPLPAIGVVGSGFPLTRSRIFHKTSFIHRALRHITKRECHNQQNPETAVPSHRLRRSGFRRSPSATSAVPASVYSVSSSRSVVGTGQCGTKRLCRQMASCEEALYYLNSCGVGRLDGDGDGVPCEKLCR